MDKFNIVDLYNIKIALSYYIAHVVGGTDREEEFEKCYEKICVYLDSDIKGELTDQVKMPLPF